MTGRTGQEEQDKQNWTSRIGQAEQGRENSDARKGLPVRAARTGLPGQDCQDRTARNRAARTGLLG
jgi:hypothetical protein